MRGDTLTREDLRQIAENLKARAEEYRKPHDEHDELNYFYTSRQYPTYAALLDVARVLLESVGDEPKQRMSELPDAIVPHDENEVGVSPLPDWRDPFPPTRDGEHVYTWDECAVTFVQTVEREGYEVEVADSDGVVVKMFVYLHEWSGHVSAYINTKNVHGLISYLKEIDGMDKRPGTVIRGTMTVEEK